MSDQCAHPCRKAAVVPMRHREEAEMGKSKQGVPGLMPSNSSSSHFTNGGVRLEFSDCCDVPVKMTRDGVVWKVCGKCGRKIVEQRVG